MKIMLKFFLVAILLICTNAIQAQDDTTKPRDPWKNTRDGNGLYKTKDFAGAEKKYKEAVAKDTSKTTSNYNLGNALYEQKKFDEAEKAYADALDSQNPDTLNRGWYNLGNSLFEQGKLEESANAYKEALKNNPNDENARYNLAMTQKMIKARKEKEKEEKNLKKDPKGKYEMKDSAGNKKDKKNDDKGKEDGKENKEGDGDKKNDVPLDPKKQSMTPEEARKVLNVLRESEQQTRERMDKNGNGSFFKRSRDKDW